MVPKFSLKSSHSEIQNFQMTSGGETRKPKAMDLEKLYNLSFEIFIQEKLYLHFEIQNFQTSLNKRNVYLPFNYIDFGVEWLEELHGETIGQHVRIPGCSCAYFARQIDLSGGGFRGSQIDLPGGIAEHTQ